MSETTGISWAQSTFNIVWGCDEVAKDPACSNCYAREQAKRYGKHIWGKDKSRELRSEHYWNEPVRWNRKAEKEGRRHRVFCSSMADVFEDHKDLVEPRKRLWEVIAKTPNLDWMLLTKRPENMVAMGPEAWAKRWPDNVWAGTTAATQEWADKRCPILAQVPAKIRWLSVEPMLGPMNLAKYFDEGYDGYEGWVHTGSLIQWVIVGGESGRHARLMEASWALDLLKQCRRYDVSFFFKQQGDVLARVMGARRGKGDDPTEWPEEFKIQEFPRVA